MCWQIYTPIKNRSNIKIIIVVCLTLLFSLTSIQVAAEDDATVAYSSLIQTYEEYIKLEEEIFKDLVFTLSEFQIKKGETLKLILEDQLGRKWIFKSAESDYLGSRIAYLLYKLFGLNTPEVHYKIFNINGKFIRGNIQRFIPNQGTLEGVELSGLPENCLNYLLKTHIFYWLITNIDASRGHNIIVGKDRIKEILRIDLRVWWFRRWFDKMKLRYDCCAPWDTGCRNNCYYDLWKDYMSNKISLRLDENYEFIIFISNFPDEFFKKLLFIRKKDPFNKIDIIIKRKRNLPRDFKAFYRNLLKKKGETVKFSKQVDYHQISNRISKELKSEIYRLRNEKAQLKNKLMPQGEIAAVFSYDAYKVVRNVYNAYWKEKVTVESLFELCDDALEELNIFYSLSTNKWEKKAIECYREEIKRIKSTGKPSNSLSSINKLVDVIPNH